MTGRRPDIPHIEEFEHRYLAPGLPSNVLVHDDPRMFLFARNGREAGLRIRTREPVALRRMGMLAVTRDVFQGEECVEVTCSSLELFRPAYWLLGEIATNVAAGLAVQDAMVEARGRWKALVNVDDSVAVEIEVGCWGELHVLARLASEVGWKAAVEGWVGPTREEHDFRLASVEVEVKTTRGRERVHHIHGQRQLMPCDPRRRILLASCCVREADDGTSVADLRDAIFESLAGDVADLFRRRFVEGFGEPSDWASAPRKWKPSRPLAMIPVLSGVPRIDEDAIAALGEEFGARRIRAVNVKATYEGLGVEDGDPMFGDLLR